MRAYLLRRVAQLAPVVLLILAINFTIINLAPGDPISAIVPPDAPKEVVDKLKEYYGFDKPLPVQYLHFLGQVVSGDLGESTRTGTPVTTLLGSTLPVTLWCGRQRSGRVGGRPGRPAAGGGVGLGRGRASPCAAPALSRPCFVARRHASSRVAGRR